MKKVKINDVKQQDKIRAYLLKNRVVANNFFYYKSLDKVNKKN